VELFDSPLPPPFACIKRRKYHISLDVDVYRAFYHLCRRKGHGRPNRVIEAFMIASIKNPMLIKLALRIAKK
jgi:hypothetical protein